MVHVEDRTMDAYGTTHLIALTTVLTSRNWSHPSLRKPLACSYAFATLADTAEHDCVRSSKGKHFWWG